MSDAKTAAPAAAAAAAPAAAATAAAPAAATAAASTVDLTALVKKQREWAKALFFTNQGKVIASTVDKLDEKEIKDFLQAYADRDTTVGKGFQFCGHHFDVHRFHDNLIYGRRGDANNGEGIALCRVLNKTTQKYYYGLITYVFPTLSARAVPQLRDFCKQHLESL